MGPIRKKSLSLYKISLILLVVLFLSSCRTQDSSGISVIQPWAEGIHRERESIEKLSSLEGQVRFQSYSVDDGLSMNTVHDVMQDDTGYIWIATEDGLNRYDGYHFEIHRADPSDLEGLSSSNIQSLFEDQQGYLWLGGNEGGIMRYDPYRERLQHYSPKVGNTDINNLVVSDIAQENSGVMWFGTNDGLYRYDQDAAEWSFFHADMNEALSLSSNIINSLLVDASGHLWVGSDQGLDRLNDEGRFAQYSINLNDEGNLNSKVIIDLYQDQSGNIWIGSNGGLIKFDPIDDTFRQYQSDPEDPKSISNNSVTAITENVNGNLWIGTRDGLNLFNPESGKITRYMASTDNPDSLSDDWILAMDLDDSGGLWIATAYGGVNYYHPLAGQFKHYLPAPSAPDRISENSVWTIYQDEDGILWMGTNGGGLKKCVVDPFSCTSYRHDEEDPTSLGNDVILDIDPDGNGGLWIATWGGGLNYFNPEKEGFTQYRSIAGDSSSISSDVVWLIYEDSQGALWIGTDSGLNTFNPKTNKFTRFMNDPTDERSISNNLIVGLFEDSRGQLWIGTQDGLNRFNRETGDVTRFYHDPTDASSLSHNTTFAFFEDENDNLWIGTYGGGLNRYNRENESFTSYRMAEGLVNDSIYGILGDDDGNMWISTNNGISMFDPKNEVFKNYGIEDGLQAREFNFNGYYKNDQGEMFFGGVNGVTAFNPKDIIENPYPPKVVLQSITQGGLPMELDQADEYLQELLLQWPNNFFDFEFAALNYFQAEKNQHAYMLENFDDDWNMIGDRRNGRYTNLPGGTYTLRITGSNNDGLWNEPGKGVLIRVVPPLWQNPWILVSVGLMVAAASFLGYRYRVQMLKTKAEELEEQIQQRTIEINTRRKQIEALYKADEDLYRHLELDQVLQALVDTAVEILKADKGSLLCWDDKKENLVIRASHNFNLETVANTRIPKESGVVGQVVATGETIAVEDTVKDSRVTLSIVETEGIRSFIQVPIKTGEMIFGVFSADYAQPRSFSNEERRLLISLAQRAAIAIQNAQIYEQAQELAASQERNRLARELHDAVTQTLFSASLIAEALPALWERDPEKGRERLAKLRQMSRGALAEMRALLLELRPAALFETNLNNLLRQLGEAVMGRESINVNIRVDGDSKLPEDIHIAFYRIAQEAINNVVKHARAKNVTIELTYLRDGEDQLSAVTLAITDDGRGFRSQEPHPQRLGLGIMRERAESIKASLDIESHPEQGTKIVVKWLK